MWIRGAIAVDAGTEPGSAAVLRVGPSRRLDCLSDDNDKLRELLPLTIQNGAIDQLKTLLQLHRPRCQELADEILRMIVLEGSARLATAFFECLPPYNQLASPSEHRQTPLLHIAVEQDNIDLVWTLVQHGNMDPNSRDHVHRRSALHYAVEWDNVDIQRLLVRSGADIDTHDVDGWTSLHIAAQNGYLASLEFLLSDGAHLNKQDNDGLTPLHIAAREGHVEVINYLLENGADLHATDVEGRTVLHLAAFVDESAGRFARSEKDTQATVVATLLNHGADVSARDAHGYSVLHCARRDNFDMIVDLLKHHRQGRSHPAKKQPKP